MPPKTNHRPHETRTRSRSGAVQAGAIAVGLFIFTSKVESAISIQALPDAYTARNMAVTVRTIIIGLLYLVTFIFSANAVGLGVLYALQQPHLLHHQTLLLRQTTQEVSAPGQTDRETEESVETGLHLVGVHGVGLLQVLSSAICQMCVDSLRAHALEG